MYHWNAVSGPQACIILGQLKESMKLNAQVIATEILIARSRMYKEWHSAEYVKGTGPSPKE
jgi:hypothetical protein